MSEEALWAKARSPDPFRWGGAYRRSVAPPDPASDTVWMKNLRHNQEVELCHAAKKLKSGLSKSQSRSGKSILAPSGFL
ncbi:hypothetical protein [Aneurinibacillus soli]|uniref:hypothetical protein n=1 Tax=Aneurinibacillus soli TaxID=1500254 RepID=UPI000BBB54D5|nr:hypothetical protein [Aneurinibacillus soli]